MLQGIHPGWIGLGFTLFGLVFGAGSYHALVGFRLKKNETSITVLENRKQDITVCDAQHVPIGLALTRIEGMVTFLYEDRKNDSA